MLNLEKINLNNLYTELLKVEEMQRTEELATSSNSDKTNNYSDFIKSKLEYVPEIQTTKPELQKKFLEVLINLNNSDRKNVNKLSLIATYAALINTLDVHLELLTAGESILLATAMSTIPLHNYEIYGDILSSKTLLQSVESSTTDIDDQMDIFDEMLDILDEIAYPDMETEDYENAVKGCINIASAFQKKNVKV